MADRRLNPVVRFGGADQQQMGEREPAEQPVADAGHVQPGPLDRTGQVHRGADWEAGRQRERENVKVLFSQKDLLPQRIFSISNW